DVRQKRFRGERLRQLLLLIFTCSLIFGQDFRATITGQVTDRSRAAIPNAIIKATQRDTNEVTQTKSNGEGYYTLAYLTPNSYVVEVSALGFKSIRRENIVLLVADKLNLPFTLDVGQIPTEITLNA